jgi:NAD(P)-dependent dehydrogenase (short-subunit alcohol dehydrogenase family)
LSRALAQAGHTVYATMRETTGRNAPQVAEVARYAAEQGVDLRTVELDVASPIGSVQSCSAASASRICSRRRSTSNRFRSFYRGGQEMIGCKANRLSSARSCAVVCLLLVAAPAWSQDHMPTAEACRVITDEVGIGKDAAHLRATDESLMHRGHDLWLATLKWVAEGR